SEFCRFTWAGQQVRGYDLDVRHRGIRRRVLRCWLCRSRQSRRSRLLSNAVNCFCRDEVYAPTGNCHRSKDLFVGGDQIVAGFRFELYIADSRLELFLIQNLTTSRTRLKNKKLSVLGADVKLSVGEHRG